MTVYDIHIDERQRKIIEIALKNLPFEAIAHLGVDPMHDSLADEIHMFHSLVEELPEVEAAHPGTIHGLCL